MLWSAVLLLGVSLASANSHNNAPCSGSGVFGISGGATRAFDDDTASPQFSTSSNNRLSAQSTRNILMDKIASKVDDSDSNNNLLIVKRDGQRQELNRSKLFQRLDSLANDLDQRFVKVDALTDSILLGVYPNVTSSEIDILAAETAASMSTQHPDYARLAARIRLTANHKTTPAKFSSAIALLNDGGNGFIDPALAGLIERHADWIDSKIVNERDLDMTYFGFKTLERAYLLRTDEGEVVERPQYLMMRVALGIHCTKVLRENLGEQAELIALEQAFETYNMMSQGYFTHASPTLFHSGTTHPQLSSCFLVQMSQDSISGIYDTLKQCAEISKSAGGIGLSVHNIRARGTHIKGTRGEYRITQASFAKTINVLQYCVCSFCIGSRCVEWAGTDATSV